MTTFPAWNVWNFLTVKAITALWATAAGECLFRLTTEAGLGKWDLVTQASGHLFIDVLSFWVLVSVLHT